VRKLTFQTKIEIGIFQLVDLIQIEVKPEVLIEEVLILEDIDIKIIIE